jgi:hypothetical protein
MRKLLLGLVSLASALVMGCAAATPGYSGGWATIGSLPDRAGGEMANRIIRNWRYEYQQMNDDIYSILLLDPASHLTKWNVR